MSYFHSTSSAKRPKCWKAIVEDFSDETHEAMLSSLSYYRVPGQILYVDRPYREDRHGHLEQRFRVDLPTIPERPKKTVAEGNRSGSAPYRKRRGNSLAARAGGGPGKEAPVRTAS